MKRISAILLLSCLVLKLAAQVAEEKKPSTFVFHAFYNDFKTAQLIRTSSFGNVFKNNLWSRIGDTQMGFGVSYLKGISNHIDFVAAIDGSSTDYLFKDGSYYGNNQFLLDINAGVNIKLLTDHHPVVPYLLAGAGFSAYQGKTGFYVPVGAGFQFNVFNQAFVFTNMQYRRAVSSQVNDHFQYSIGIGAGIGKKKKAIVVPQVMPVQVTKHDTIAVTAKISTKDIVVTVTDEQTGLPLPNVNVTLTCAAGKTTVTTDTAGRAVFSAVPADDYTVAGVLDEIPTTTASVLRSSFDMQAKEIKIGIIHNDPRFTLAGVVNNKATHQPEGDVMVTVINTTQNSSMSMQSQSGNGAFSIQLDAANDFTISGKKAGYISNIEKVTTKGLNRSTTLYVKLQLDIEQAAPNKTISLSNIYYDSGSARIRAAASSDLEKLVKFLKDNPGVKIEIASHTDSRGSAKINLVLSRARAQTVVNYLQKNGIDKSRLTARGYGATRLVNGCKVGVKCTESQHEQNRRTEFKVINN